ncbi:MAG: hypothetical protein WB626_08835, partial [Bacteroidota bacterium]
MKGTSREEQARILIGNLLARAGEDHEFLRLAGELPSLAGTELLEQILADLRDALRRRVASFPP